MNQNVETKNTENTLSSMMQNVLRNMQSYSVDEESGKLSSSLLGDVMSTAVPGLGLAGTIGRRPLAKLIPSLANKIGAKKADWKKSGFIVIFFGKKCPFINLSRFSDIFILFCET